jgi:L-lactate dehydrogenase (cytochrome)
MDFDTRYPSVESLREKARRRMPRFAFEYLDGGCNEDVNLHRNTSELREVRLEPRYIRGFSGADTSCELFGQRYDAPFGIAPVGLQGLMWPNAPEILARAAHRHNIPFILSTVTTMAIERAAELTEGRAWFQLYNPVEGRVRKDVIRRAAQAGCPVLVVLCDVPTFGYRPRDIKNGLAMPPKMSLANIAQILGKPRWALQTLKYGQPGFKTLEPYIPKGLDLKQLGLFMNQTFSGLLDPEKIKPIRDQWRGKLVLKGVASEWDARQALQLGFDGIIVSNHGGRQLDAGEATIKPLQRLARDYGDKLTVMVDSGLRGGPDVARAMASGAAFTFMGRSFMYGVGALGARGGEHTISMLKTQFRQNMEQLCCERVANLPGHLIQS